MTTDSGLQQADMAHGMMGSAADRRTREATATGGRASTGPAEAFEYHRNAHDSYDDGLVHNHHWAVSGH